MFAGRFSASMGLVGVDIGRHCVKLLQLRDSADRVQVIGAARCENTADDHHRSNPGVLAERLRIAFNSGGFTGRRCVVSLPRHAVHLQSIRLPRMPDADLADAVRWEAAQRFDLPREALEADFLRTGAVLPSAENREELLLIAASHDQIHTWIDPLREAGLRPVHIEAGFTAVARAFSRRVRRAADVRRVRAVVEIGAAGSTVIILRGDQIAFCKPLATGGERFDRAVADHLQLDEVAARELRAGRIAAGADPANAATQLDDATDRAVFDAVRPLVADLAKEVMLCLRHYGVTFRGYPPDRIILTGGDALEPRLDAALADACGVPVHLDDEVSTVASLVPSIVEVLGRSPGPAGAWAVAAGLSLRGTNRVKRGSRVDEPSSVGRGAA